MTARAVQVVGEDARRRLLQPVPRGLVGGGGVGEACRGRLAGSDSRAASRLEWTLSGRAASSGCSVGSGRRRRRQSPSPALSLAATSSSLGIHLAPSGGSSRRGAAGAWVRRLQRDTGTTWPLYPLNASKSESMLTMSVFSIAFNASRQSLGLDPVSGETLCHQRQKASLIASDSRSLMLPWVHTGGWQSP